MKALGIIVGTLLILGIVFGSNTDDSTKAATRRPRPTVTAHIAAPKYLDPGREAYLIMSRQVLPDATDRQLIHLAGQVCGAIDKAGSPRAAMRALAAQPQVYYGSPAVAKQVGKILGYSIGYKCPRYLKQL